MAERREQRQPDRFADARAEDTRRWLDRVDRNNRKLAERETIERDGKGEKGRD